MNELIWWKVSFGERVSFVGGMYYCSKYAFRVLLGCVLIDFIGISNRDTFWIQQE